MEDQSSILSKITLWFEKLSALPKAIISIIAIVGTFSGYMTIHDKKVINRYDERNEQLQVKNQVTQILKFQLRDSVLKIADNRKIDSLIGVFGTGMQSIDALKRSNENLKAYLIKNAVTKQDVLEVVRIFDEKKN